jgi:hypothetical protein
MIRNFNFKNNQRLDISHLKMIESSVTNDLKVLTGNVISGNNPIIIKGFTVSVAGVIGNPATSLQMITAGSVMIHPLGSEEGGVFTVSSTQAPERLNVNNFRVIGSFTSGASNYIGIDLIRTVDTSTSDTVSILSDTTGEEFTQLSPLGNVLDYRIYIQTSNFNSTPNICPVAVVVVDALGGVSSVTDARPLAFRLGTGGTSPSATTPYYSLPDRVENSITFEGTGSSPFTGGDKNITSLRDWMAVVETRIWEGSGGAYWYSPSSVNDIRPAYDSNSIFSEVSENWYLDGADLLWQGIRFIFSNGTNGAYYCTVADQTTALVGLTDLNNGECLYIDIDRTRNAVNLPVTKANFAAMPQPTIPGSRLIIAWKNFGSVYVYGQSAPVNTLTIGHASTVAFGTVKVYSLEEGFEPVCPTVDLNGNVIGTGLTNPGPAIQGLAIGTTNSINGINIGRAGITTKVMGKLISPRIAGGGTGGGSLTLLSTTDAEKGRIFLSNMGIGEYLYFDEKGTPDNPSLSPLDNTLFTYQINGNNGLTLLSTSNNTKGHINFEMSGLSYFDEQDNTLQVSYLSGIPIDIGLTLASTYPHESHRNCEFPVYPVFYGIGRISNEERTVIMTGFFGVTLARQDGIVYGWVTLPHEDIDYMFAPYSQGTCIYLNSSDPANFPSGLKDITFTGPNSFTYSEEGPIVSEPIYYPQSTIAYSEIEGAAPLNLITGGVQVGDTAEFPIYDGGEDFLIITEEVLEVGDSWFKVSDLGESFPAEILKPGDMIFYYQQSVDKGKIFFGSTGNVYFDEVNSVFQVPTIKGSSEAGGKLTITSYPYSSDGIIKLGSAENTTIDESAGVLKINTSAATDDILDVGGNMKVSGNVVAGNVTIQSSEADKMRLEGYNNLGSGGVFLKLDAAGEAYSITRPYSAYLEEHVLLSSSGVDYTIFNLYLSNQVEGNSLGTWILDLTLFSEVLDYEYGSNNYCIKIKDNTGKVYHSSFHTIREAVGSTMHTDKCIRLKTFVQVTDPSVTALIVTCSRDSTRSVITTNRNNGRTTMIAFIV